MCRTNFLKALLVIGILHPLYIVKMKSERLIELHVWITRRTYIKKVYDSVHKKFDIWTGP